MDKSISIISALVASAALIGFAQDPTGPDEQRLDYEFKHKCTPQQLDIIYNAPYGAEGNTATTTRGNELGTLGDTLLDFKVSPATITYVLVGKDKKGSKAVLNRIDEFNKTLYKFKDKKLGQPTAAEFTPDAREVLISTDRRINILDARTFELIDTIPANLTPRKMLVSHNAYYVAAVDGPIVSVYDLEKRTQRFTQDFDGPVSDICFNDDDSELGILTDDGMLSIFDTRTFLFKRSVDDLEGGLAFDYNSDGKYVAVATRPDKIEFINLLDLNDRDSLVVAVPDIKDLKFIMNDQDYPIIIFSNNSKIRGKILTKLLPFYGRLIHDEANEMLNEWLKMMPGETMEQYNIRVTDETRKKQLKLYEDEISTRLAEDMVSMSTVTLGQYDRANQMLEVNFDNMPSILLPVEEANLGSFTDTSNLQFRNAKYGVMNDDKFELIYAEVYNSADGQTYIYNNIDRAPLNIMRGADNMVSIEVIQQQQMDEIKLQEIKETIVEEAKSQNIISEHTNISVDSRVEPSYDSDGNKIVNYIVKFTYEVDPEFTVYEDFGPGKYHIEESGAASSMMRIVKEAFEGDFAQYVKEGKKLLINISGTADASPIKNGIKYDGSYGEYIDEPVYKDGVLSTLTVTPKELVKENEQLAFLRALGVQQHLENNVSKINEMNTSYQYHISVSKDKGSQFRRITTEFIFVDSF